MRCWGGPLDGLDVRSTSGRFLWFDESGKSHKRSGVGRFLYEWRAGGWQSAEHQLWVCKCGGFVDVSADKCPLCGSKK